MKGCRPYQRCQRQDRVEDLAVAAEPFPVHSGLTVPRHSLAVLRRGAHVLLLVLATMVGWARSIVQAQESGNDLTELSLEQLLEVEVAFLDVNVMGGHTHTKGQWMVGFDYMFMDMEGNRNGTHHVSTSDILKQFNFAPTNMRMQMQMFELMYAPSDDLSLMAMVPIKQMTMDQIGRAHV